MDQKPRHVHMIAICGIGMGSLAGLLKTSGYHVTGSDENVYPPMSTQLESLGIRLNSGYCAENVADRPDLVIIGNAAKANNPEVQAVLESGLPYMSFPEALAEFFIQDRDSLVVTGTHGKTTSTSMLAWVLESAGHAPSLMVGGVSKNFDKSFKVGDGRHFVVEGDEYRTAFFRHEPKFRYYRPRYAMINSLEFDHADIFRDLAHIQETFREHLVTRMPEDGFLAVCTDYPAVDALLDSVTCPYETYGLKGTPIWGAHSIRISEEGTTFTVTREGRAYGRFFLPLAGRHNVQNSLGVIALAHRVGLSTVDIKQGLATYQGVKRRQDIRGKADDIIVIDDFAHHPTEVRETVKAIKARFPRRRVWAIFEPRTQSSRRNFFQKDYTRSFEAADFVVVADVFMPDQIEPERLFNSEKLVHDLVVGGHRAYHLPHADAIVAQLRIDAKPGDVVVVMSNGAFDGIHDKLLLTFAERAATSQQSAEDEDTLVDTPQPVPSRTARQDVAEYRTRLGQLKVQPAV